MKVYFGNKKIGRIYSGDKEIVTPTTEASLNQFETEYLLVAAGGEGQDSQGSFGRGGGGAGGLLSGSAFFSYSQNYPVSVISQGNSSLLGLTAIRGGNANRGTGGSGAGAAGGILSGGLGTPGQGNNGGGCTGANTGGGGGGGAGQVGETAGIGGGAGGDGLQSAITGTLTWYAGGGGGAYQSLGTWTAAANGQGGGGSHYGGGTAGASDGDAETPGPGICVIRYRGPQKATGGTITTDGDYVIHTFTTSGTFATNQKEF